VRNIYFPPIKSLPLRAWITVMIVVPTLSEGDKREYETIFAVIRGFKTSAPNYVSGRVNHECSVIEQCGANTKSPGKKLKRGCAELWCVALKKPT